MAGKGKAMCIMCGRIVKEKVILEIIDGQEHIFDKQGCLAVFRRLRSVYNREFLSIRKKEQIRLVDLSEIFSESGALKSFNTQIPSVLILISFVLVID